MALQQVPLPVLPKPHEELVDELKRLGDDNALELVRLATAILVGVQKQPQLVARLRFCS